MTTATTTFQTVARELAGAFELATRADGSEFYRLAATAPAWIVQAEVGHAAHVAVDGADCRFPDDWIYRLAARAADWLADSGYTSADDARYDVGEFADGAADVSVYSLFTWAAAHANNRALADEFFADSFGGFDCGQALARGFESGAVAALQGGQSLAAGRVAHAIVEIVETEAAAR